MAPKTILVTGASKGLGLAIAECILSQPHKHNLVAVSRDQMALEKLKSRYPGRVEVVAGDLTDFALSQTAVDIAQSAFGGLHGLIVNHGTLGEVHKLADCDPEGWQKTFDINVFSAVACIKAAIPELRKTNGSIILTSSGASTNGSSTWGAYGASKACLNSLALTLCAEEPTITTLSIRPGKVDTVMQQKIREKHKDVMEKKDWEVYMNAYTQGQLLRPDQPGNVMARVALNPPHDLSGRYVNWNDEALEKYQD